MCILCTIHFIPNSVSNSVPEEIICSNCPDLTDISNLSIRVLTCLNCPNLKTVSNLPNLVYLECFNCPSLTTLSDTEILRVANCCCTGITSFPNLPNLLVLSCSWSENLKEIPLFPKLQSLVCINCPNLVSIHSSPNYLDCSSCRFLLTIPPNIEHLRYVNSPWIKQTNTPKVVFLQRLFRKYLLSKKLLSLIPQISEIYYSPNYKGFYLTQKHFNLNKFLS